MARSAKIKSGLSTSNNAQLKTRLGGKSSRSVPFSPLMKVSGKDYSKKTKSKGVEQFGIPSFGLTGMTGED